MSENCKCNEKTANINVNANVNAPQANVSTGGIHFEIAELNYGSISLKGLKGNIESTITDENVRLQCDFVGKLFQQLVGKFGDCIVDNINANTERQRQRIKEADREFEQEHKYDDAREKRRQEEHEADLKYKESQTKYYNAQADREQAEADRIKAKN